ncbi:autophagy-related protein 11 domain-containing protein [Phthorimaea operculella]|nr:autophagy-related protein 11 domain-containing protein [Phthorimaea operculella]
MLLKGHQTLVDIRRRIAKSKDELSYILKSRLEVSVTIVDLSSLPTPHCCQLEMLLKGHQTLVDIRRRIAKSKDELSYILKSRLEAVLMIENSMSVQDAHAMLSFQCFNRLARYFGIVAQLHMAPNIFVRAVHEVARRRKFSEAHLKWATDLAAKLLKIHEEEVSRRQEFNALFEGHFLRTLFPGMTELPPAFATQAPPLFDNKLPKLTDEDVEFVSSTFPDLAKDVPSYDMEATVKFFQQRLSASEHEERDVDVQVDISKELESETDTSEFERLSRQGSKKQKNDMSTICAPDTAAVSTVTEDNMDTHRINMEKLQEFLVKLCGLCRVNIVFIKEELAKLKNDMNEQRNWLGERYIELLKEWERNNEEAATRFREQTQRLTFDHEIELSDMKASLAEKDDIIETLKKDKEDLKTEHQKEIERLEREHQSTKELLDKTREEISAFEKKLEDVETNKQKEIKELQEKMHQDYKAEIESLRSRFRLVALTNMDRSPSESSLEKIERTDVIEITSHNAIVMQTKENAEVEKEEAVRQALAKAEAEWREKMQAEIAAMKTKYEQDKQVTINDISRRLITEKGRQLELLREREQTLMRECTKYRETIQQLTDPETNDYDALLKTQVLLDFVEANNSVTNSGPIFTINDISRRLITEKGRQLELLREREQTLMRECTKYRETIQQLTDPETNDYDALLKTQVDQSVPWPQHPARRVAKLFPTPPGYPPSAYWHYFPSPAIDSEANNSVTNSGPIFTINDISRRLITEKGRQLELLREREQTLMRECTKYRETIQQLTDPETNDYDALLKTQLELLREREQTLMRECTKYRETIQQLTDPETNDYDALLKTQTERQTNNSVTNLGAIFTINDISRRLITEKGRQLELLREREQTLMRECTKYRETIQQLTDPETNDYDALLKTQANNSVTNSGPIFTINDISRRLITEKGRQLELLREREQTLMRECTKYRETIQQLTDPETNDYDALLKTQANNSVTNSGPIFTINDISRRLITEKGRQLELLREREQTLMRECTKYRETIQQLTDPETNDYDALLKTQLELLREREQTLMRECTKYRETIQQLTDPETNDYDALLKTQRGKQQCYQFRSNLYHQRHFRRLITEKGRQLELLREREQTLMRECTKYRETIQQLTDPETNDYDALLKTQLELLREREQTLMRECTKYRETIQQLTDPETNDYDALLKTQLELLREREQTLMRECTKYRETIQQLTDPETNDYDALLKTQLELLREREQTLMRECTKYRETIQQLTDPETNDYDALLKTQMATLENEKALLQQQVFELKKELEKRIDDSDKSKEEDSDGRSSSPKKEEVSTRRSRGRSHTPVGLAAGTLSLSSCLPGHTVLVMWEPAHLNYTVMQEAPIMYFVHSDCLPALDLSIDVKNESERKLYAIASVESKEYCYAKKSGNRYHMPRGSRFYRVRVRPLRPSLSHPACCAHTHDHKHKDIPKGGMVALADGRLKKWFTYMHAPDMQKSVDTSQSTSSNTDEARVGEVATATLINLESPVAAGGQVEAQSEPPGEDQLDSIEASDQWHNARMQVSTTSAV